MSNTSSTANSSTSRSDWRQVVLGIVISGVCLAVILWFVDLRKVGSELLAANKWLLAVGFVMVFVWLLARTVVWRSLLQGKVGWKDVFLTLNEGYLLNNFLPFRLGEVSRAFLLSRKAPVRFVEVLATILLERAFDVLFAVSLVLAVLPFLSGANVSLAPIVMGGGVVIAGLTALFLMARFPTQVMALFQRVVRWPRLQSLVERFLPSLLDGLSMLKDTRRFLRTVLFFLINLALAAVHYYITIRAFFPEAQPIWAIFCLGVSSLGLALPSSPGGVGVFEGAVIVALAAFGADADKAFACGVMLHLWNYLFSGVIGSYALARDGESLLSLYRKIRSGAAQERQI